MLLFLFFYIMAVLSWFMSYTIMRMSTYDGVDVDFLSVDTNCRRTLSISLVICSLTTVYASAARECSTG